MIIRDKPNALSMFFILRGSVVPRILPQIIGITTFALVVVLLQQQNPQWFPASSTAPFALLGIALSLFLGFRNNACYDRWWEARKQWGQLIVDVRSFSRQLNSYLNPTDEKAKQAQHRMSYLSLAFTLALRHRLRDSNAWPELQQYLLPIDTQKLKSSSNLPDAILRLMGLELANCLRLGLLPEILVKAMDERLTSLAQVLAACERIKSTPLPFAYMLLVHRTAYLYCFLLPLGLVTVLGFATPIISALVAYTFFGLDALSEELEQPFGMSLNHLALADMSRNLEINIQEALGKTQLPKPLQPEQHYLP